MNNNDQYRWFTKEQISSILAALESRLDHHLSKSILTELQVAEVRSTASNLSVSKLQNALGLPEGSIPLWLSPEEYTYVTSLI